MYGESNERQLCLEIAIKESIFILSGIIGRYGNSVKSVSDEMLNRGPGWPAGDSNPQLEVTRNIMFTSPTLCLLS